MGWLRDRRDYCLRSPLTPEQAMEELRCYPRRPAGNYDTPERHLRITLFPKERRFIARWPGLRNWEFWMEDYHNFHADHQGTIYPGADGGSLIHVTAKVPRRRVLTHILGIATVAAACLAESAWCGELGQGNWMKALLFVFGLMLLYRLSCCLEDLKDTPDTLQTLFRAEDPEPWPDKQPAPPPDGL